MGKYSALLAKAKVRLTDITISFSNISESSLKLSGYVKELRHYVDILEKSEHTSIFSKFKDLMIDDDSDIMFEKAADRMQSLISCIDGCMKCRCASCLDVSKECSCRGCIAGNYITECDGKTEKRLTLPQSSYIDGKEVKSTVYTRSTGELICTTINNLGAEEWYEVDLRTNKTKRV